MGSYNHSCFVTKQTIAPGDPARVFFIRDRRGQRVDAELVVIDRHGITHRPDSADYGVGAFANWSPIGVSIKAIYSDYGLYDLPPESGASAWRFMKAIAKSLLISRDFGGEFGARLFEKDVGTAQDGGQDAWTRLMNAADRGLLYSRSAHPDGIRAIRVAAMHEAAYQHLLDASKDVRKMRAERIVNAMDRFIPRFLKHGEFASRITAGVAVDADAPREFQDDVTRLGRDLIEDVLVAYGDGDRSPDDRQAAIAAIIDLSLDWAVLDALDDMNLALEPSRYAGQDYDNSVGQAYAKMVSAVSEKVVAQRAFEDEFDHDDEEGPAP